MHPKKFRLFISSTFDDFRKEREALQTNVFPYLKAYCFDQGYAFQPIDLRWGINDEAQWNQKTLELCLNEVRSCKSYAHPNFLILIGDRYGWIPLPYRIEKVEFETLIAFLSPEEKTTLLNWYKKDMNQVPPSYTLIERIGTFISPANWAPLEQKIRSILQKAVHAANLSTEKKRKYFTSATEAEAIEGIYSYMGPSKYQLELLKKSPKRLDKDSENIFGFIRDIEISSRCSNKFIAEDYDRAQDFKQAVGAELQEKNVLRCKTTQVSEDGLDESYLIEFVSRTKQFLKLKVEEHIQQEKQRSFSALALELEEQKLFAKQKRKNFTGQEVILSRIEDYINSREQQQALVIYGKSGIGKSSVMAKAIDLSIQKKRKVIFRFIGATPDSVYIKKVLHSIFLEMRIDVKRDGLPEGLRKINPEHIPDEFYEGASLKAFSDRISKRFEKIEEELVLFIDAVNQLNHLDSFIWLPEVLPSNLKIIISVLSDEGGDLTTWSKDDLNLKIHTKSNYLSFQKKRDAEFYFNNLLSRTKNIAFIDHYHEPVVLLQKILAQENRTIQKHQEAYFLQQFRQCPTPFYVYVAAQAIKNWKSYDLCPGFNNSGKGKVHKLASTQQEVVQDYLENLSTLYHHDESLIRKVFGYIYASQNGLSENEILELLSLDKEWIKKVAPSTWHNNPEGNLPLVIWARLTEDIRPFLNVKHQFGEELLYFFHWEFEEVISSNRVQQKEHEHIINSTQKVLVELDSLSNRYGKLYIQLVAHYAILYKSKLKEYSVFITNGGFDDVSIEWGYISSIIGFSEQFRSHNRAEREYQLVYLLSAAYTLEALHTANPERWHNRYLSILHDLTKLYDRRRESHRAAKTASIAYNIIKPLYHNAPEKYVNAYLDCLIDLAWSNRDLNEEKTIALFDYMIELVKMRYKKDPDRWSERYANNSSILAIFYRFRKNSKWKALFHYKMAFNIAEIQHKKYPRKWKTLHEKYRREYESYYNYELSFFDKFKYEIKKIFPRKT